jgi:hypothetical protein
MPQSASGVTGPRTCAESIVTAPVLREDSQREREGRTIAHVDVALPHALFSAGLETGRVARVFANAEPPPGHQKPPTVLRL